MESKVTMDTTSYKIECNHIIHISSNSYKFLMRTIRHARKMGQIEPVMKYFDEPWDKNVKHQVYCLMFIVIM